MTDEPLDFFSTPVGEMLPGIRRGACYRCLGPARSLYSRIDLTAEGRVVGSFAARGTIICSTGSLVTNALDELPEVVDLVEQEPEFKYGKCAGETWGLALQIAREWTWLRYISVCRTCRTITDVRSGRSIPLPRPIPHRSELVSTADPVPTGSQPASSAVIQVPRPVDILTRPHPEPPIEPAAAITKKVEKPVEPEGPPYYGM